MNRLLLLLTIVLCATVCLSQRSNGKSEQAAQQQTAVQGQGLSCVFDFERGEVPDCIRKGKSGRLFISPRYLTQLKFEGTGLAAVHSLNEELMWLYVDRKGLVRIDGVPRFENGPDEFHDGLVRIVRHGKYGFADINGRVVISVIYDGAMPFENGKAKVCKGCKSKCAEPECEHHFFAGGEWFTVDTHGQAISEARSGNTRRP